MYYRIKEYAKIFPDFPLYFRLCKIREDLFYYIYPENYDDLFQMIALCILQYKTHDAINNGLHKEMYNYVRRVLGIPSNKNSTKKRKYPRIPKYELTCDICKKSKQEYMLKKPIPGKQICGSCASKIRLKNNREVKNMHTVDLIANAIRDEIDIFLPDKTELGICCLTGIECQTMPKKDILSSNFTNTDLLKAPDSDRIGIAACIALKYRWERRSCWYVDDKEFIRWDKNIFRDFFLNGVKSKTWAIYITTSYKKHGSLFTKVNRNRRYGVWRFEQLDVNASDRRINKLWYRKISEALIKYKIGRSVVETLDCPPWLINKIGLDKWMAFYNWAKDKYQSPLYKLCCYLLPSQKELKENED